MFWTNELITTSLKRRHFNDEDNVESKMGILLAGFGHQWIGVMLLILGRDHFIGHSISIVIE